MSYADDPDLLARLYAAFRATPLHALLGLEFVPDAEVPASHTDQGTRPDAVVSMPVRPEAYGSTGNLHGGAVATLIDVAAATAAARTAGFDPGRNALVTADLHVRYLKRPTATWSTPAPGCCTPAARSWWSSAGWSTVTTG